MVSRMLDFQRDVLDRSHEVPVLVDFWADWCGPCKILGPVLERLAETNQGAWVLVKIDTESYPDIARQHNVRSIPSVKLFVGGVVTSEFVGALPESQVRQWLQKSLPDEHKKLVDQAEDLLAAGNSDTAQTLLCQVLEQRPEYVPARVLLAKSLALGDPPRAAKLVENLEEPSYSEYLDAVRTLARLHAIARDPEQLAPSDTRPHYLSAIRALFANDIPSALQQFIEIIRLDRYYDEDGSRKACIAVFKLLGEENDITMRFRRDFSSALY
jgi:putative thioredoxin